MKTPDTNTNEAKEPASAGCHDAACSTSFEHEWLNHGYTFRDAVKAKNAYETWAGEKLSYEDVNYAITGKHKHAGLFCERITAFFAGFRLRNPI